MLEKKTKGERLRKKFVWNCQSFSDCFFFFLWDFTVRPENNPNVSQNDMPPFADSLLGLQHQCTPMQRRHPNTRTPRPQHPFHHHCPGGRFATWMRFISTALCRFMPNVNITGMQLSCHWWEWVSIWRAAFCALIFPMCHAAQAQNLSIKKSYLFGDSNFLTILLIIVWDLAAFCNFVASFLAHYIAELIFVTSLKGLFGILWLQNHVVPHCNYKFSLRKCHKSTRMRCQ